MAKTSVKNGSNNRDKIINTAMRIIGEKGVKKTTLAEIARQAGISKGTLYYYFSSKNDLIFDIADIHMSKITGEIFAMIDTTKKKIKWEELMSILFDSLLSSKQRGRFHLYLLQEAIEGNMSLCQRFQETYCQWFSMINDAYIKMGSEEADHDLKARMLVAVLDGLIIQVLLNIKQPQVDLLVNQAINLLDGNLE